MDRRSLVVLVIAAIIFIGSFVLDEYADYKKGELGGWYTFTPPYSNEREAEIAYLMKAAKWSRMLAIVAGVAGGFWLVISVQQKKK
ncbi:hypothetical protein FJZ31_14840 [Candidatus Poribacteria bacterium]|nr:hypothetical protein [Candidatus Poribacteria bacterium]